MLVDFLMRNQRRPRIARVLRLVTVTKLTIPHAVRLNVNFANIIARAYVRAWKGEPL